MERGGEGERDTGRHGRGTEGGSEGEASTTQQAAGGSGGRETEPAGDWQPLGGQGGAAVRGSEGRETESGGREGGPQGEGAGDTRGGTGQRRSSRAHARDDRQRSLGEQVKRKAEQEQRRVRARRGGAGDRAERRAEEREGGRARAAAKIVEMARAGGWALDEELREVGGIGRIRERWRWSFTPAGAREQLVLFNHGERGGRAVQEVRAAILESVRRTCSGAGRKAEGDARDAGRLTCQTQTSLSYRVNTDTTLREQTRTQARQLSHTYYTVYEGMRTRARHGPIPASYTPPGEA